MNIAIVGTGYVGLVTGTCLASLENRVTCVDIDAAKVERLQHGHIPIYEPGLEAMFAEVTAAGLLAFTTDLAVAAKDAEVIFLALPTPPGEDGSADLSYVLGVADQLGPLLQGYAVIVNKSTVPVGTAERVRAKIAAGTQQPFDVVSNPEFLREGMAVKDFMQPDRVVIGASSQRAIERMSTLYEPFTKAGCELIVMDEASAELTKYAANSFLVMKISFMNEIANICERVGANVDHVRHGIGSDWRIGKGFLHAGIGYGGSCFPKDVLALAHIAQESGYDFKLIRSALDVNTHQVGLLQEKVLRYFNGDVSGKTFALWGLAFKPETDDIREAPALKIIRDLVARGATIQAYDPQAMERAKADLADVPSVRFMDDERAALQGADALLIATQWPQFKAVPLADIKQALAAPVVFDGRNMFSLEAMRSAGIYYESIGRTIVTP